MATLKEKVEAFRALHVPGEPLVLFNIWDAGSAQAVARSGAKALATGSWSVAHANGFEDGESVPLDFVIENFTRIARSTELPVTGDIERGYGERPEDVARSIARCIEAGIVGCNMEDSVPSGGLRDIAEQVERIRAARKAADAKGVHFFLNLRSDVFFKRKPHDERTVAEIIERAKTYAEAGADGLFAPGLVDARLIGELVKASPLPVNVMVSEGTPPLGDLASLGVARVSHGPGPYALLMQKLAEAATASLGASQPQPR